ncbi:MAG: outer membrane lipoprotein carrier protein LolA [Gemmatimonadota bacterium]
MTPGIYHPSAGRSAHRATAGRWLLAAALAWAMARPAGAITGGEVIEHMQSTFAKASTYSARFERRFYWAVLDRQMVRQGHLYTRKPSQFRVEVEGGDLVVADGKAIWAYAAESRQVVVSPYAGELRTPWEILVEYADSFSPVAVEETALDGRDCYLVTLSPRPDAAYTAAGAQVTRMRVWVERKGWQLLQVEQLEANDDVRTYVLRDHRVGKKLDEALFRFQPPDGVEVIDRREAGPAGP